MCNAKRRIPAQCYKKCCLGAVGNHGRGEKKRCFSSALVMALMPQAPPQDKFLLIICVLFPFLISIKIGPQKVDIYPLKGIY